MPLAAVQPADIKRFARHVADRGVSASTVRLALAPVKAMLADAFEAGDIRTNPAAGVRLALNGTGAQEDKHAKALTEEEFGRLLAQIPEEWRLFFELLAQTGLRIGEAIALHFGDVDFDRRRVQVRRRYYRGASPRRSRATASATCRSGLVSLASSSSAGCSSTTSRRSSSPRRPGRCSTPRTLFHRGVNPKQAQVWLGHHSPAFTLAVYTHLLSGDLPEVDLFEGGNTGATSPAETGRNGNRAERAEPRMVSSSSSAALAIQSVS